MIGMANLPFTYDELQEAVADKRVTKRDAPRLPYSIYNYSDAVQYSRQWDDITRNCRGLILDWYGNIVARPWQKFFNLGEVNLGFQFDDPVEIMDKVDGSLGILYPTGTLITERGEHKRNFAIATRGSFLSTQAIHASRLWSKEYAEFYDDFSESGYMNQHTLLFEIIYPTNRIVLDYHGMDDLVLLGAVEKETGYYLSPKVASAMFSWPGPVVDVMEFNTITDALANTDRENKEGFVIRRGNFMVKVKQPDYLDLHRLVTNLSAKSVWEQLREGKTKNEIVSAFPDEFHRDVENLIDPLVEKFRARHKEVNIGYQGTRLMYMATVAVDTTFDRGKYARSVKDKKDKNYYFALLDNKDITAMLWSELKPRETDNDEGTTAD